MKREISYLKDVDIVLVKTSGKYIFQEEMKTVEKALELMQRHHCKRLFFDHSETEVIVNPGFAMVRVRQYDDVGFCRSMKIACVGRDADYENLNFFELASSNRGWQTKLFKEHAAAIEWLTTS